MNGDMELQILYEDEELLAVRKPAGVAVQTKRLGVADMESLLKNYRAGKGEPPYIGIVHRLDQPVEGVMVFAKTGEAAGSLGKQMQSRQIDKYYYAMVDGVPPKKKGTLEDYLLRDGKTNTSAAVSKETAGARRAALSYEVQETGAGRAILRISLETGRHHQIRVQLANAGWPIVGDRKYNFKENMKPYSGELALCSYKICIRHPKNNKKLMFEIDKNYKLF